MRKILNIAWKDMRLTFRDSAALILMLLTPMALTVVVGFAFGGFGGGSSSQPLADIPVILVNEDAGQFGQGMVEVFLSQDLADLVEPVQMADEAAARTAVDTDQAAAAVIIPETLTSAIIPPGAAAGSFTGPPALTEAVIEVYANPTRPVSAMIVRSIVDRFLSTVNAGAAAARITIQQMVETGLLAPEDAFQQGQEIGSLAVEQVVDSDLISLQKVSRAGDGSEDGFDWLRYMAISMAVLFLMFTISAGGRSILAERDAGTLPRMLVSPTAAAQVLGGKVLGIFLTGLAQMVILILANHLLLGVDWGNFFGVAVLVVALVFGATGWGILLAAISRTPGQVSAFGTALALIFAAAAGNFVPRQALPDWLRMASYISPNAWGMEGFDLLLNGAALDALAPVVLALSLMGIGLFTVSMIGFRRQFRS